MGEEAAKLETVAECCLWTKLRLLRPEEHGVSASPKPSYAEASCSSRSETFETRSFPAEAQRQLRDL